MTRAEEDAAWELFERVSGWDRDWPGSHGFREPGNSRTYSFFGIYYTDAYPVLSTELALGVGQALRSACGTSEWIYALDWNHECYRWFPHVVFEMQDPDSWPVPILPNGDYYFFIAQDARLGVLGHPWDETMTFWGEDFLASLERDLPSVLRGPIRIGGRPTGMSWTSANLFEKAIREISYQVGGPDRRRRSY